VEIQQVDCSKYLVIFIDSKLLWPNHIDYIYNEIIKFTSIFYKMRDKINFDVAKMIYFAFVHSHLAYGIEICGNTYTNHLNKLMILNNKLLRTFQNAPRDFPVVKLYANFNTFTLPELHTYQILKFVHKCIYHQNKLPSIFSNYFIQNSSESIYITPAIESIFSSNLHTVLWDRDLLNLTEAVYATIPDELKSVIPVHSFAKHLKNSMLGKSLVPL